MLLIVLTLIISSCSIKEIREEAARNESLGHIKGTVTSTVAQRGGIIVLRYRHEQGIPVLEGKTTVNESGEFSFTVYPGKHYIGAFIDSNSDGRVQENEYGRMYGLPDIITVADKQTVTLNNITITGLASKKITEQQRSADVFAITKNIGIVTTLDDPTFTRDNYNLGMWHPNDFLENVGGGLFMLQPYHSDKIPVLFVHGVNGGPTDWQATIGSLDTSLYQPWVIYYPSGFRLDLISEYFLKAVVILQEKYRFDKFAIVAHSMGGLVTRSYVKKYFEQYPEHARHLKLVMTVNSPMGGMASAAVGLEHSPIISSAWHDVAPGSDFLKGIHGWRWPKDLPYHLAFSFMEDESGDGVVALQSQLPTKLQAESVRLYGFNNSHVGTLSDPEFLEVLSAVLSERFQTREVLKAF